MAAMKTLNTQNTIRVSQLCFAFLGGPSGSQPSGTSLDGLLLSGLGHGWDPGIHLLPSCFTLCFYKIAFSSEKVGQLS